MNAALVVAVLALVGLLDCLGFLLVDMAVVVGVGVTFSEFSLTLNPIPSLERVPASLRASGAVGGGRLMILVETGVELDPVGCRQVDLHQRLPFILTQSQDALGRKPANLEKAKGCFCQQRFCQGECKKGTYNLVVVRLLRELVDVLVNVTKVLAALAATQMVPVDEVTHVLAELLEVLRLEDGNPDDALLVVDELLQPEDGERLGLRAEDTKVGAAHGLNCEDRLEARVDSWQNKRGTFVSSPMRARAIVAEHSRRRMRPTSHSMRLPVMLASFLVRCSVESLVERVSFLKSSIRSVCAGSSSMTQGAVTSTVPVSQPSMFCFEQRKCQSRENGIVWMNQKWGRTGGRSTLSGRNRSEILTRPKPWPSSSENMRVTSEASAKSFFSGRLTMPRIGSFSRRAESRTAKGRIRSAGLVVIVEMAHLPTTRTTASSKLRMNFSVPACRSMIAQGRRSTTK